MGQTLPNERSADQMLKRARRMFACLNDLRLSDSVPEPLRHLDGHDCGRGRLTRHRDERLPMQAPRRFMGPGDARGRQSDSSPSSRAKTVVNGVAQSAP
jgi:hypothetical protein